MAEKIKNGIRCSFCGKKQEQIDRMISGSNGHIFAMSAWIFVGGFWMRNMPE